jgi:glycosyltransferase involved in cell wall biosynthesis
LIEQPLLSIVITSYTIERLKDILELLDSIKAQTYPNIETIFIVERSQELKDRIGTWVQEKGVTSIRVVFNTGEQGLSPARNLGIKHARGDIIAFVDDDAVLLPDWAEETVKTYRNNSAIGVTGPAFPLWEDESLKWLPEEFYWIISCTGFTGWGQLEAVRSAWGENMSFRKEAFEQCLFSEGFGLTTGEQEAWKAGPIDDVEFSINLRLRTKKLILYNPAVRIKHRVYNYRLTSKFIRRQAYWQGYTKALMKKTYHQDTDTRELVRERTLLRNILFGLVPRTITALPRQPRLSWGKITLTVAVLFYVTLGYSAVTFPWVTGFTGKYFAK